MDPLHKDIAEVCKQDIGIGISFDLLRWALERQIAAFGAQGFSMPLPLSPLQVRAKIAPGAVRIAPTSAKDAVVADVAFTLVIHLPSGPQEWVGQHDLSFVGATIGTMEDPQKDLQLAFQVANQGTYGFKSSPRPPNFGALLASANISVSDYDRFESAVLSFTPGDYLRGVVASLRIPQVRNAMKGLLLGSPLSFGYTATHLVAHSPVAIFEGGCPVGGSAVNQLDLDFSRRTAQEVIGEFSLKRESHVAPDRASKDSPMAGDLRASVLFYYPEKVLLDYSFGILKPSVTLSDSGTWLAIFWHYAVTAALKRIKLTFRAITSTEAALDVEAPVQVFALAGAGIEIACVRYEVIGAKATGGVDPLNVTVQAGLDTNTFELYLSATPTTITANMSWSLGLGFPLDQIADWILDRILDKEIRKVAGRTVDVFRVKLADIVDLHFDLKPLRMRRLHSNARPDSLLLALDADPGRNPSHEKGANYV